jgi:CAAX protease family protein
MRPLRSLLFFVLFVFVGGALLAPQLYFLLQKLAPASHLATSPFHRYVNRSLLILALVGMWPLLRSLGAKSWKEVGLTSPKGNLGKWGMGFLLGFGSLACVALIVLLAHGRALNHEMTPATLASKMASAAATAVTVSVVEEILFRGAIFGALRRIWNWRWALIVSSMIYAIVHFMESAKMSGPVTWHSGLELLPRMLRGFGNLEAVIPGFFNLTLAGILLGLAYQRTGNLYFSIGLHAGWIFWLKAYNSLTSPVEGANIWFWGTMKMIDGWLAMLVLMVTVFVLQRMLPEKPRKSST